jgi:hypothetical protein
VCEIVPSWALHWIIRKREALIMPKKTVAPSSSSRNHRLWGLTLFLSLSAEAFVHQGPTRLEAPPGLTPNLKFQDSEASALRLHMARLDEQERPRKRDRFQRDVYVKPHTLVLVVGTRFECQ